MKMLLALAAIAAMTGVASAQYYGGSSYGGGTGSNPNSHYVQPHTNNNGTTTQGHYQTNPNGTQRDNYGTNPNVNPYTGQTGTRRSQY